MFLDDLIKENQYPIIFAGAGLTKRYYSDAPSWSELIKNIWTETLGGECIYVINSQTFNGNLLLVKCPIEFCFQFFCETG